MAAMGFIGFLFPMLFLGLIILVIAALVGARGEPDPTGRRPYAIYLSLVTFIGLFTTLGSLFALVKSFFDTVIVSGASDGCPPGLIDCGMSFQSGGSGARGTVTALLIVLLAGALTFLHGRKLLELRGLEPGSSSSSARTLVVFGYAVSFAAVFGALAAVVSAATSLVDVLDPQFGNGEIATSNLMTGLVLAVVNGLVFRYAWSWFDLGLKTTGSIQPPPAPPTA